MAARPGLLASDGSSPRQPGSWAKQARKLGETARKGGANALPALTLVLQRPRMPRDAAKPRSAQPGERPPTRRWPPRSWAPCAGRPWSLRWCPADPPRGRRLAAAEPAVRRGTGNGAVCQPPRAGPGSRAGGTLIPGRPYLALASVAEARDAPAQPLLTMADQKGLSK